MLSFQLSIEDPDSVGTVDYQPLCRSSTGHGSRIQGNRLTGGA